jgi:hypothetical protein
MQSPRLGKTTDGRVCAPPPPATRIALASTIEAS